LLTGGLGHVITYCRHGITIAVGKGLESKKSRLRQGAGGYRNPKKFKTVTYSY